MWLQECPNFDQGLVRPLVSAEGVVVLYCDSGDCTWLTPADVETSPGLDLDLSDWSIAPGIHLTPGQTRWAEADDLPPTWQADYEWHEG
ncbi:hypothetical protein ACFT5B_19020 [Luteimicrobium sp. NPDC057192]|uniref:hypothetical protein n=1 Tax=Luteimicrobium sp. NPDC057192 TaxID=3346042 RepID=UPI00363A1AE8